MPYGSCVFCDSVTAYVSGDPVCGTCDLMLSIATQTGRLDRQAETNREQRHMQNLLTEENELWESDADPEEGVLLRQEVRQQMAEAAYPTHSPHTYISDEDEDIDYGEEEELYQDDQDDFDFGLSYQAHIQAIRDELSARQFDLALDRAAIVQRLLRIFVTGDDQEDDDVRQTKEATETDIATLKTRTLDISNDFERNTECSICTEKFEHHILTELPCNHEYHSECIHHWLKLNASCPMCRRTIFLSKMTQQEEPEEDPRAELAIAAAEGEPDIIIIRGETADGLRQNNSPASYMDDVD